MEALQKEHAYWTSSPKLVRVARPDGRVYSLSRYYADWDLPRPESYRCVPPLPFLPSLADLPPITPSSPSRSFLPSPLLPLPPPTLSSPSLLPPPTSSSPSLHRLLPLPPPPLFTALYALYCQSEVQFPSAEQRTAFPFFIQSEVQFLSAEQRTAFPRSSKVKYNPCQQSNVQPFPPSSKRRPFVWPSSYTTPPLSPRVKRSNGHALLLTWRPSCITKSSTPSRTQSNLKAALLMSPTARPACVFVCLHACLCVWVPFRTEVVSKVASKYNGST